VVSFFLLSFVYSYIPSNVPILGKYMVESLKDCSSGDMFPSLETDRREVGRQKEERKHTKGKKKEKENKKGRNQLIRLMYREGHTLHV